MLGCGLAPPTARPVLVRATRTGSPSPASSVPTRCWSLARPRLEVTNTSAQSARPLISRAWLGEPVDLGDVTAANGFAGRTNGIASVRGAAAGSDIGTSPAEDQRSLADRINRELIEVAERFKVPAEKRS